MYYTTYIKFCETYGVSYHTLMRRLLDKQFKTLVVKDRLITAKPLIRRQEFRKKVWLRSHDYYYKLSETLNDSMIAEILMEYAGGSKQGWVVFMSDGLFSLAVDDMSILDYKISNNMWKFFRFSKVLSKLTPKQLKGLSNGIRARHTKKDN